MKKTVRLIAFLLLLSTVFSFTACKKDDDKDKAVVWDAYNYENLAEFITLPNYKNYTVSQTFIDREINLILASLFDDCKRLQAGRASQSGRFQSSVDFNAFGSNEGELFKGLGGALAVLF